MKQKSVGQNDSASTLAETLNDCSIDRVMAVDMQWRIIAWNKTAEDITGRSRSEVLGMHLLDAFPELSVENEMLLAIETAMKGQKSYLPAARTGFNRVNYENHFIPLQHCGGDDIQGVMNIMHDVAHRVKAEQQLYRLNVALEKKYQELERASAELSTYTYVTSKNIKDPLRQLYTGLEYLVKTEGRTMSEMGKANLRRMQSSLNRMNLLVEDILALSGIDGSKTSSEEVDLNEVLNATLQKLGRKIEENTAVVDAADLPVITGNRAMLETLFYHLLDNAIKFHEPNASPRIRVEGSIIDNPDEHNLNAVPIFKLSVQDNGIGFKQEDADRMFNMFEKLNEPGIYKGSGMGLTICRKIVQVQDGNIKAFGTPGKGAEIVVQLPVG